MTRIVGPSDAGWGRDDGEPTGLPRGARVMGNARAYGHRLLELRRRRLPGFKVSSGGGGKVTVYYVVPDRVRPSGGIRVAYRHVDLLNEMGVPAAVMHHRPGFSCEWFPHSTKVVHGREVTIGPQDLLVVPEWYGPSLHALPEGLRVVVFNQCAYDTFDEIPYSTSVPGAPYRDLPGLVALLTVSRDNREYLRHAFPGVRVDVTRNVVDGAVFHPGEDGAARKKQISFTMNRRARERDELLHILRSRGVLDGWQLVPIAGMTESETARVMRESAVFVSLSEREGFGLPPAEAMASGCYVVGYPGLAGREFFDAAFCDPVPEEDLIALARAVERACAAFEASPQRLAAAGRRASENVLSTYTIEGLRADLRDFYLPLLRQVDASAPYHG